MISTNENVHVIHARRQWYLLIKCTRCVYTRTHKYINNAQCLDQGKADVLMVLTNSRWGEDEPLCPKSVNLPMHHYLPPTRLCRRSHCDNTQHWWVRRWFRGHCHVKPWWALFCKLLKCASFRILLMESYEKLLLSPWKPYCEELEAISGWGVRKHWAMRLFWLCVHDQVPATSALSGLLIPLLLSLLEDCKHRIDIFFEM